MHLLPSHHLRDRDLPPEDESCPVSRKVLPRKLRFRELLNVRSEILREDRVGPTQAHGENCK